MEGGRATAEILLGLVEPSGRLPISFARHVGQHPTYYNQIRGQHGERYADLTQEPAFVFGEGLSYTDFSYGAPKVVERRLSEDSVFEVRVVVSNVGDRRGTETVQLYVRDLVTSVSWADKELKAFTQVDLEPGESREVALELPVSSMSIVNQRGERVVEPGEFELLVGYSSSSGDLQGVIVEVL